MTLAAAIATLAAKLDAQTARDINAARLRICNAHRKICCIAVNDAQATEYVSPLQAALRAMRE